MNIAGGLFIGFVGLAMLGLTGLMVTLDRRGWLKRKIQLREKIKAAKEAVRSGTATEEQKRLDKENDEVRRISLFNPVEWMIHATFNWLYTHRAGWIIIELWLLVHGTLFLVGIPNALRNESNILAVRLTFYWFFGFLPAGALFAVTVVIFGILLETSIEAIQNAKKRSAAVSFYIKSSAIIAAVAAVIITFSIYFGWIKWLLGLYPAAWNRFTTLPSY